jgi:hypothetical protein
MYKIISRKGAKNAKLFYKIQLVFLGVLGDLSAAGVTNNAAWLQFYRAVHLW